jgi:hypothetical protein
MVLKRKKRQEDNTSSKILSKKSSRQLCSLKGNRELTEKPEQRLGPHLFTVYEIRSVRFSLVNNNNNKNKNRED